MLDMIREREHPDKTFFGSWTVMKRYGEVTNVPFSKEYRRSERFFSKSASNFVMAFLPCLFLLA